jgi:hypothetical protein
MAPACTETQKRCEVAFGTTPITFFGLEWQFRSRRLRNSRQRRRWGEWERGSCGDKRILSDRPVTWGREHADDLTNDVVITGI